MFRNFVKKCTKWIGIPLFLALLGTTLSIVFFFNSDINPNVLSYNHTTNNVYENYSAVKGKFIAQNNYLGLVTLRFNNTEPLAGDTVFRIKNIVDANWYHVATIAAIQYSSFPLYSFGMPIIAKSKNQTYEFEIQFLDESLNKESLTLSNKYPVLISQYKFPKKILIE
ncbi:MAG: hypothetical protein NTV98_02060, partial [Candidatus Roizmanbacteria bacterium]|nr:hypothetical protein [Candidatus Roizmanbacteria bacterium]